MAKKKTTTAAELFALFAALDMNEQQEFVDRLPAGMLVKHPWIRVYFAGTEIALDHEKDKRKPSGNPARDAIIVQLSVDMKPAAIGRHPQVVAANQGKRMSRQAVQNVLTRKGGGATN